MTSFAINIYSQTVKDLFYYLKKCCKNPILADNKMFNFFCLFLCILAESGTGKLSMAEKADGSKGTIMPFVTSDNSRRDNETCWLLEGRSLTNPPDLVILSPKTTGSVIPQAECS